MKAAIPISNGKTQQRLPIRAGFSPLAILKDLGILWHAGGLVGVRVSQQSSVLRSYTFSYSLDASTCCFCFFSFGREYLRFCISLTEGPEEWTVGAFFGSLEEYLIYFRINSLGNVNCSSHGEN